LAGGSGGPILPPINTIITSVLPTFAPILPPLHPWRLGFG